METLALPSVAADCRLTPQAKTVLRHLRHKGSISPMEALMVYGVARLAARIHEIRKVGYAVPKELRKDAVGQPYAHYTLAHAMN